MVEDPGKWSYITDFRLLAGTADPGFVAIRMHVASAR